MTSSERGAEMRKRMWFLIPIAIVVVACLAMFFRKNVGQNGDYEILEEDVIIFDEEADDESDIPEVVPEKKDESHTEEVEENDESYTNGEDVELPVLPLS